MESVAEPRCVLSRLAIAIVKSFADIHAKQAADRDSLHQSLVLTVTRMAEQGSPRGRLAGQSRDVSRPQAACPAGLSGPQSSSRIGRP